MVSWIYTFNALDTIWHLDSLICNFCFNQNVTYFLTENEIFSSVQKGDLETLKDLLKTKEEENDHHASSKVSKDF